MSVKVNLAVIALAAVVWASLLAMDPQPIMDAHGGARRNLEALEDTFARQPGDLVSARDLARGYLELGDARLALATIRSAEPRLLGDPSLLHELSRAYEGLGRLDDAVATERQAAARCGQAIGYEDSGVTVGFPCSPHAYASIEVHLAAIERLQEWGVTDPRAEPTRTRLAYELALRRARLASFAP